MSDKTRDVLLEVAYERGRQDARWGEQNWQDVDTTLTMRPGGCTPERMAQEYEIPTETRAKVLCETAFARGDGTYAHIAVEELCEAIAAGTNKGPAALRKELVQCAAVFVAWIECIDRRGGQ